MRPKALRNLLKPLAPSPPLPTALDANVTPVGLGQKFSTCICKKVGERQRQQTRNEIGIDRDAIEQNVEVFVCAREKNEGVYMAEWVGMYEADKPDAGRKHLSRAAWSGKKYIYIYIYICVYIHYNKIIYVYSFNRLYLILPFFSFSKHSRQTTKVSIHPIVCWWQRLQCKEPPAHQEH